LIAPYNESGDHYREVEPGAVRRLDPDEKAPLPAEQKVGEMSYAELRQRRRR